MFWKEACCSLRNKLLVYNAVIRTKLLYGLETLELPTSQTSRLEAFQLKGLQKILNMVTTFVDRNNTNEEVFRRANQQLAPSSQEKAICSLQTILQERRISLVDKIVIILFEPLPLNETQQLLWKLFIGVLVAQENSGPLKA